MSTPDTVVDRGFAFDAGVSTAVATTDARTGRVAYRGIALDELARASSFEETTALLLSGRLPTAPQLADTCVRLAANRALPESFLEWLATMPRATPPFDVLRTAVSALGAFVPHLASGSHGASARHAIALVAKLPSIVAAWDRLRRGHAPLAPLAGLSSAANLLYMRSGRAPAPEAERALDAYLIASADRAFDGATYAARLVASGGGDVAAAVTAALAATSGDARGDAPARAVAALLEMESPGRVAEVALATPRDERPVERAARDTFAAIATSVAELGDPAWRRLVRAFETATATAGDGPDAAFYAGATLYALGIGPDTFASINACARVAGWTAHAIEQRSDARPLRSLVTYTGPVAVPLIAIERRDRASDAPQARI